MISLKSIHVYLSINLPIYVGALGSWLLLEKTNYHFLSFFSIEAVKNLLIIEVMKRVDKPIINSRHWPNQEIYWGEFMVDTLLSSSIKAMMQKYVSLTMIRLGIKWWNPISFIFRSFLFELIFDFCHYWLHRGLHSNKFLYINIHKKHHKFIHPSAETTFYMSIPDLLLSHGLPLMISSYLINLSQFEFMLVTFYLSYLEIGGHIGRKLYPTSSFAQFVWIPRWLSIQLYTEDHDLHHSQFNCNYSKRFSIWDKLFGTYASVSGFNK